MPIGDLQKIPHQTENLHAEILTRLRALYPPLFDGDGKLSEREIRALVANYGVPDTERFEFRWAGKSASKRIAFTPSRARLRPNPKRGVDVATTGNCIIEGDNLEVLKLLRKSYYGEVKCIYIDPPYNTGKDFVYSDNFTEGKQAYWEQNGVVHDGVHMDTNTESAGRYHSNWLNMIQSRLLLARQLLRDDGVIFVSIDDHEVHNLRKLMDEVFGEENFVAQLIWQHGLQPKGYTEKFSVQHNYVICYQKTETFELGVLPRTDEHNKNYSNPDDDPRGAWRSGDVRNALHRPNLIFDIETPSGKIIQPPKNGWRWSKETVQKKIASGEIVFSADESRIIRKIYLATVDGRASETIWFGKEIGTTREANQELKELFDGAVFFDTPKPVQLVKRMLQLTTGEDDIVCDFFAGSGTTAQAVMELNKEDGRNRKFILVQLPEETDEKSEARKAGYTTISQITIERVKRAGTKVKQEKPEVDTGFRVFELTKSLFPDTTYARDADKTDEENEAALKECLERSKQILTFPFDRDELLAEVALKDGFDCTFTATKQDEFTDNVVFRIADATKNALICLDHTLTMPTVDRLIAHHKTDRFIALHRAFDTTKLWKLHHSLGSNLWVT